MKHIWDIMLQANSRSEANGLYGSIRPAKTNPGLVVKTSTGDKGYITFLRFASENRINPHLPKIYTTLIDDLTDTSIVKMERLMPMDHESDECLAIVELCNDLDQQRPLADQIELANDILGSYFGPEFIETVETLLTLAHEQNLGWDLHEDNVMLRADGTFVITDPF